METKKMSIRDAFIALEDLDDDEVVMPGALKRFNEGKSFDVRDGHAMDAAQRMREGNEKRDDVDLEVVDADADSEEHLLKNSEYIGQRILQCNSCHAKRFVNQDDLEKDANGEYTIREHDDIKNECPTCHSENVTYKSIGNVGAVEEEEPEIENDEKKADELTFDNDDQPEEEPIPEEEVESEEEVEIEDEKESPFDETDAADDTEEFGGKAGDVIEDEYEWDDTEEKESGEEIKAEALEEDAVEVEAESGEEAESTEIEFDNVEKFFENCVNKLDLTVTVKDADTEEELYHGPFAKLPEELLNGLIVRVDVDGTIEVVIDDAAKGKVAGLLGMFGSDSNVDLVDEDEVIIESGKREEIKEAFGDKKESHWMLTGDVTIYVKDAKVKETSNLDDHIAAENVEENFITKVIVANKLFESSNEVMWLKHWLAESIRNKENLDVIKERYITEELADEFEKITGVKEACVKEEVTEDEFEEAEEKVNWVEEKFTDRKALGKAIIECKNSNTRYVVRRAVDEDYRYVLIRMPVEAEKECPECEEDEVCPDCGHEPCVCECNEEVCPECGKEPCVCEKDEIKEEKVEEAVSIYDRLMAARAAEPVEESCKKDEKVDEACVKEAVSLFDRLVAARKAEPVEVAESLTEDRQGCPIWEPEQETEEHAELMKKINKELEKAIDNEAVQPLKEEVEDKEELEYIENARRYASAVIGMDDDKIKQLYYVEFNFADKEPQDAAEKIVCDALETELKKRGLEEKLEESLSQEDEEVIKAIPAMTDDELVDTYENEFGFDKSGPRDAGEKAICDALVKEMKIRNIEFHPVAVEEELVTEAKKDEFVDKVLDDIEKVQAVTDLIQDEIEAVDGYTDAIKEFEDSNIENKEEIISKLHHIKGEELEHMDELEELSQLLPKMGDNKDEPEFEQKVEEPAVEEAPAEELPEMPAEEPVVAEESLKESNEEEAEPIEAKQYVGDDKVEVFTELPDYKVEVEQKGDKIEIELEPKIEESEIEIESESGELESGELESGEQIIEPEEIEFDEIAFESFINKSFDESSEETKLFEATDGTINEKGEIVIEGLIYNGKNAEGSKVSFTLSPMNESVGYNVKSSDSTIELTYKA